MASLYIDGKWTAGSGGSADVLNPFDGSVVETVDQAGPDDVEAAVAAARAAFDDPRGWRATSVAERAGILRRIADRGLTILIIDHDMLLVSEVAQHITVLNFGRRIADGESAMVLQHPDVVAAYLGTVPDAPA